MKKKKLKIDLYRILAPLVINMLLPTKIHSLIEE